MNRVVYEVLAALALAVGGLTLGPAGVSWAQTECGEPALSRAVFEVENMTCAACPITARTAMGRVQGVQAIEVDFERRRATVLFDSGRATARQIAEASRDAGYSARQMSEERAS